MNKIKRTNGKGLKPKRKVRVKPDKSLTRHQFEQLIGGDWGEVNPLKPGTRTNGRVVTYVYKQQKGKPVKAVTVNGRKITADTWGQLKEIAQKLNQSHAHS